MKTIKITENQLGKLIKESEEDIELDSELEVPNWLKDFDEPVTDDYDSEE